MSDVVNTAEIRVVADSSGVEVGLQPAITAAEKTERKLIESIKRTSAIMEAGSRTSARYYEIIARQRGVDPAVLEPYLRQLRAVEEAQRRAATSATSTADVIKDAFVAAAAGFSVVGIVEQVISAQREFDKLNASLVTATGSSEKATQAFEALQAFAATTPYGVAEATEAFVKMRNLGLDPSERALRSYGNTAAAMGKSLEQMVEAVADASTGEFERLKEFGIKASQNGEKLTLTFKGTSTTIKNDATAIEGYLMKLGEVDFAGAMAKRAATLDGAISGLGDTWESTMRAISTSGIGEAAQDGVIGLSAALNDLETILQAISAAADKQAGSLNGVEIVHKGLTTVFEAVSVLGVNVAYVLTQVGKELGGLAAQAKAVATGEFQQARIIGELMKAEAERDRKEVDAKTAAILGAVEKAKQAAAAVPTQARNADRLAEFRIEREAERESAEAAKRRADQLKRETAALAELAGLSSTFAAEWKMLSKLYADGKINLERLTKAQADLLAKQPAMKDAAEQEIKDRKAATEAIEQYEKAFEAAAKAKNTAVDNLQAQRDENAQIGLSAMALAELNAERLEALALQAEGKIAAAEGIDISGQLAEQFRDEAAALRELADAKREGARKQIAVDSAKKAQEEWKRASEDIERSLTDALLRGFESGKSFGQNLVDTLKNMFSTLVLRPIIQAAVQPVASQITSFMQGGAGSAGGNASFGNLGSLASLFGKSGAGTGTAAGSSGMLGGMASYGGWIAAGMALADGLFQKGYNDTSTIQKKDYVHPLVAESLLFNKVFQAFGLNSKTANLLSGASIATALFGRKAPEIESQGIQGTFGGAGFSGQAYANVVEKGGLFRSTKRYVSSGDLSADQDATFDATYKALVDATKGFASTLGIEAGVIDGYNKQIKLELGKDEAKNQEAIAKLFGEIGDELSLRLVPNLSSFALAGEATSATLQRLVTDYATVDEALTAIGMQFGAVGVQSLEARERLIDAAGGLEAFAANTAGFQQNFLTEAERNAPVLKAVTEQLAALGLTGVDTRDEFKQVVLGLDLTTEAGAKQYGALIKMQAAFAQVYPVLDATADAAAQLAEANKPYLDQIRQLELSLMSTADRRAAEIAGMDAATIALYDHVAALKQEVDARDQAAERARAVADEAKALQDQYDELTMSSAQLAEKVRNAIDPANRARYDEIQAIKAQQSASEQAAAAIKQAAESAAAVARSFGDAVMSAMQRAEDQAKSLRDFGKSLLLGNLSTLDPTAKYLEAKKQFEAADPSNTQAAQAFLQASKDRGGDSFYYERDFAAVQAKLAKGAKALDDYAASLPAFYLGYVQALQPSPAPVVTPVSTPSVVEQTGTMSKSSAQQADINRLEAKVDGLLTTIGDTMQEIATSTADTAKYIGKVTDKGAAMRVS
ncbi:tape measure protein [uncultured Massilia sp.]|uniref:tape measure protein n=1 Tax=uncultured Massilia sp. TaxID=169973 RepID=UPI002589D21D|nr:tape measure protein [uncultured Massilia sp.]